MSSEDYIMCITKMLRTLDVHHLKRIYVITHNIFIATDPKERQED